MSKDDKVIFHIHFLFMVVVMPFYGFWKTMGFVFLSGISFHLYDVLFWLGKKSYHLTVIVFSILKPFAIEVRRSFMSVLRHISKDLKQIFSEFKRNFKR